MRIFFGVRGEGFRVHRGTLLMRNIPSEDPTGALCLGIYGGPRGEGWLLMSEVPLHLETRPVTRRSKSAIPHGGLRLFHPKSTCITQPYFGPYVVPKSCSRGANLFTRPSKIWGQNLSSSSEWCRERIGNKTSADQGREDFLTVVEASQVVNP